MAAGQLRQTRRRIRSIQNTAKITRAMELVAASKMRRAQLNALAARPYEERLRWVLADLAETLPVIDPEDRHPLLQIRDEVKTVELIYVTPNRGLSGGLPANLNRVAANFLLQHQEHGVRGIAVGRKGRDFLRRMRQELVAEFLELGDYPTYVDVRPIAQIAMEDFISGAADEVYIEFAQFVNMVTQTPIIRKILPIEPPEDAETEGVDYIYEPSREAVLAELLPRYVERLIYDAILEAVASEQSARMVAMRSATDNANDLIKDLTLVYNKARQESITSELLDIVGGVEAMA
ncbi:MAG TPA: ATP synthase F1 subunit gamma [Dehalococcoidia bacterium]|nr:ATP synthase F1 subunit gamma [Dehalococcoidia bacterium]